MSYCGCGGRHDVGGYGGCVYSKIKEIIAAQRKVMGDSDEAACPTSCDNSVKDLLTPPSKGRRRRNTTIPFALYCKGTCGPFIGSGIYQGSTNSDTYFCCVESPIFRARGFEDDNEQCVRLELLLPATADGTTPGPAGDGESTICPYFPGDAIENFQATGICITVDLNNFFAITCLDPVRPLPVEEFPYVPTPR